MQPQRDLSITPGEYLILERQADTKSEYYDGEVFAMAGASEQHNLIVANAIVALGSQLKGQPCKVYPSDMRVKAPTGLYTYPDISISCGQSRFDDQHQDTLLNPVIIIEVLSKSTESYDRGKKFEHYRTLDSLTDYLLISQDRPMIEYYTRQPDNRWLLSEYKGIDAVVIIVSIQCQLSLPDVYDKVEFLTEQAPSGMLKLIKERGPEYTTVERPGYPGQQYEVN